jgi:uncharacterized membrane protein SpoIIM required for sporulation
MNTFLTFCETYVLIIGIIWLLSHMIYKFSSHKLKEFAKKIELENFKNAPFVNNMSSEELKKYINNKKFDFKWFLVTVCFVTFLVTAKIALVSLIVGLTIHIVKFAN